MYIVKALQIILYVYVHTPPIPSTNITSIDIPQQPDKDLHVNICYCLPNYFLPKVCSWLCLH